ncbi:MAG: hypothetical protein RR315_02210 [Oscillospiraceae bacterium]
MKKTAEIIISLGALAALTAFCLWVSSAISTTPTMKEFFEALTALDTYNSFEKTAKSGDVPELKFIKEKFGKYMTEKGLSSLYETKQLETNFFVLKKEKITKTFFKACREEEKSPQEKEGAKSFVIIYKYNGEGKKKYTVRDYYTLVFKDGKIDEIIPDKSRSIIYKIKSEIEKKELYLKTA